MINLRLKWCAQIWLIIGCSGMLWAQSLSLFPYRTTNPVFLEEVVPVHSVPVRQMLEKEYWELLGKPGNLVLAQHTLTRYYPICQKSISELKLTQDVGFYAVIAEKDLFNQDLFKIKGNGPWDIPRSLGRSLGLEVSVMVDERHDPVFALDAVFKRIKALKAELGDWTSAVAAAYLGKQEILDAKYLSPDGIKTPFWNLRLDKNIRKFVARLIIIKWFMQNPRTFGMSSASHAGTREFPSGDVFWVNLPYPTSILSLCQSARLSINDFGWFNPHVLGNFLRPGRYKIRVPSGRKDSFLANFVPQKPIEYIVKKKDTWKLIAKINHVGIKDLKSWNPRRGKVLYAGQKIQILYRPEIVKQTNPTATKGKPVRNQ